jgi:hypothetical protein
LLFPLLKGGQEGRGRAFLKLPSGAIQSMDASNISFSTFPSSLRIHRKYCCELAPSVVMARKRKAPAPPPPFAAAAAATATTVPTTATAATATTAPTAAIAATAPAPTPTAYLTTTPAATVPLLPRGSQCALLSS